MVHPGGRVSINPYYLGYSILIDIEQRWDTLHAAGETSCTGREKLFEVRRTEDDISLLRNYLTTELTEKLDLFAYGSPCTHTPTQRCPRCQDVVITSRKRDAVLNALLTPRYNSEAPHIVVRDASTQTLYLEHLDRATTFLDRRHTQQTLAYVAELWKHPVHMLTHDEHGKEVELIAPSS
jgi:stage V sporulation protein R